MGLVKEYDRSEGLFFDDCDRCLCARCIRGGRSCCISAAHQTGGCPLKACRDFEERSEADGAWE